MSLIIYPMKNGEQQNTKSISQGAYYFAFCVSLCMLGVLTLTPFEIDTKINIIVYSGLFGMMITARVLK